MRTILYLLISVLLISVLRMVIGMIGKAFGDFVSPARGSGGSSAGKSGGAQPQALEKDPVCGVYVARAQAYEQRVEGKPYYFCSAVCRDKFLEKTADGQPVSANRTGPRA
jgi:YHS domain-containing protein